MIVESSTNNTSDSFPSGGIIMWSGTISNIPNGWALCNGENNTPNLMDKFVVGAGSSYTVGSKGGASTVTLSEANLPAHMHIMNHSHTGTISVPAYTSSGTVYASNVATGICGTAAAQGITASGTTSATIKELSFSGSTESSGEEDPVNILPPYYALCYIMKL